MGSPLSGTRSALSAVIAVSCARRVVAAEFHAAGWTGDTVLSPVSFGQRGCCSRLGRGIAGRMPGCGGGSVLRSSSCRGGARVLPVGPGGRTCGRCRGQAGFCSGWLAGLERGWLPAGFDSGGWLPGVDGGRSLAGVIRARGRAGCGRGWGLARITGRRLGLGCSGFAVRGLVLLDEVPARQREHDLARSRDANRGTPAGRWPLSRRRLGFRRLRDGSDARPEEDRWRRSQNEKNCPQVSQCQQLN